MGAENSKGCVEIDVKRQAWVRVHPRQDKPGRSRAPNHQPKATRRRELLEEPYYDIGYENPAPPAQYGESRAHHGTRGVGGAPSGRGHDVRRTQFSKAAYDFDEEEEGEQPAPSGRRSHNEDPGLRRTQSVYSQASQVHDHEPGLNRAQGSRSQGMRRSRVPTGLPGPYDDDAEDEAPPAPARHSRNTLQHEPSQLSRAQSVQSHGSRGHPADRHTQTRRHFPDGNRGPSHAQSVRSRVSRVSHGSRNSHGSQGRDRHVREPLEPIYDADGESE